MSWRRWFPLSRLNRHKREHDIDREIRAHLELEAEEQQDAGLSAGEARAAAERAFGNRTLIAEDLRAIWGTPQLDALLHDVRYALRSMRRAPGFAGIAVASSALGIAGCSVIFAIFDFAVLRPLPVDEPGRLVSVSEINRRTGEAGGALSYPDFRDLRQARSFEGLAASDPLLPASIGSEGDPQRHWGALVTANYFAVVKPRVALGRGFDPDRDDTPGAPPSVVLSHDLWQLGFAGDVGIVGRSVSINRRPATVIGVTAAGFRGTAAGVVPEFWIPFSMIDEIESRSGPVTANRQRHWLEAVARLRAGVDVQAAGAELDVMTRTLNATAGREADRGFYIERAGQVHPELRRIARPLFASSLGVTALVLLTACSNVANLFLGRAAARRREIAARIALGASRSRLARQLLTESLVLALAGGLVGALIAAYIASLLRLVRIPLGWPLDLSIALDFRVLLFSIGVSILTAVAFGLAPALRATKPDLITDLKATGHGSAEQHRLGLRHTLVAAQVAVCTVLLVCMGLFLRSLQATRRTDLGLSNRNLLLMAFDPALDHRSDPQSRLLLRDVLMRAQAVPGVESATLTTEVPLTLIMNNSRFVSEEQATDPQAPRIRTDIYMVGPHFFRTLGISFLTGQDFDIEQSSTRRPAIVNLAFSRAAFPNQSPLGRHVVGDGKRLEIVGVVATVKSRTIGEDPRPAIYLPILNEYLAAQSPRGVTLVVKARGAAMTETGPLREAIRLADRSLAVFDVRTMESHVAGALLVPRLAWMLSAAAGCVGLVIATIGVYGVISFAVVRRRRELGIRLAIGARPREILTMVLRQGISLALVGTGLGVLAALAVTRFVASLLYGVSPVDPTTFVVAPLLLLAVALLACLQPARAAARVDPIDVLRSE